MQQTNPDLAVSAAVDAAKTLQRLFAGTYISGATITPDAKDNDGRTLREWMTTLRYDIGIFLGDQKPAAPLGLDTSGAVDDGKSSLG